jgi:dTDP-4-amino-4,6-dideoxygalactose transaminase
MAAIMAFARKHKLWVIEDCAQAHCARFQGQQVGTFGHAATFSFYPGKNLGAYGDAGGIVTNDDRLADWMATYGRHGGKGEHTMEGINSRMDGIQGAILSIKLKHLPAWTESRRANAQLYTQALTHVRGVLTPKQAADRRHVYHLYVLRTNNRDQVLKTLADKGVQCGIHYPVPLHLQDAYKSLGIPQGSLPIAERCAKEIISLPMFPESTPDQISRVVRELALAQEPLPSTAIV